MTPDQIEQMAARIEARLAALADRKTERPREPFREALSPNPSQPALGDMVEAVGTTVESGHDVRPVLTVQ